MDVSYLIQSHTTRLPIVEVDPETSTVKILKSYVASDCSMVMNPTLLVARIVGGLAQGTGTAFLPGSVPVSRHRDVPSRSRCR